MPAAALANEQITVHEVSLATIDDWLAAKAAAGFMIEPKVYAGLYWLLKEQRVR
jgi:ADP-ribose pyrophosphatase